MYVDRLRDFLPLQEQFLHTQDWDAERMIMDLKLFPVLVCSTRNEDEVYVVCMYVCVVCS